jgi:hypothetical protein
MTKVAACCVTQHRPSNIGLSSTDPPSPSVLFACPGGGLLLAVSAFLPALTGPAHLLPDPPPLQGAVVPLAPETLQMATNMASRMNLASHSHFVLHVHVSPS